MLFCSKQLLTVIDFHIRRKNDNIEINLIKPHQLNTHLSRSCLL